MNPSVISITVFVCLAAATLLGMWLRTVLPDHHLSAEAKDSVRIGMALVATMTALILGLLVASAKDVYDTERNNVTQIAAKIIHLDRTLVNYGTEAQPVRALLRRALEGAIKRVWSDQPVGKSQLEPSLAWTEGLPTAIQNLAPQTEPQRVLKAQATQFASDIGQMRWLLFEEMETSVSPPLLVVVSVWLTIIFLSIGLFAPSNGTVVIALLLAAMAAAGAIFLILELDQPFSGVMTISAEPLRNALQHLAR
jgi:hypothetical protein